MFDLINDTEDGIDSFIIDESGLAELAYIMGEDEATMKDMIYDMGYSVV